MSFLTRSGNTISDLAISTLYSLTNHPSKQRLFVDAASFRQHPRNPNIELKIPEGTFPDRASERLNRSAIFEDRRRASNQIRGFQEQHKLGRIAVNLVEGDDVGAEAGELAGVALDRGGDAGDDGAAGEGEVAAGGGVAGEVDEAPGLDAGEAEVGAEVEAAAHRGDGALRRLLRRHQPPIAPQHRSSAAGLGLGLR